MQFPTFITFFAFLSLACSCWAALTKEDTQIFELQHKLREMIDKNADFYSVLEVTRTASDREITKAYRKVSLVWHPDKNTTKEAAIIYKLITSIQSTLRDPKLRAKYDRHLKRGFPVWRGNDFYTSIWEPGFFTVLIIILAFTSIAQYIIGVIGYYRQKAAVEADLIEQKARPQYTPAQLLKELKKNGIDVSKLSKKDLKGEASSQELLALLPRPELDAPVMPKFEDLLIFYLPLSVYRRLAPAAAPVGERVHE